MNVQFVEVSRLNLESSLRRFTSFAGFWYPARKHWYFISVSGEFLGTSLPPTPIWSRFDLCSRRRLVSVYIVYIANQFQTTFA